MSDPFGLACVVLVVLWAWETYCRRADKHDWDRERSALLDRIQARSAAEYRALREVAQESREPTIKREPAYQPYTEGRGGAMTSVDVPQAQMTYDRLVSE